MLEKISLNNFKAFRELKDLKIRPITILCGTNSCGKSSILQSVLLLKQTIESKSRDQTLLLNGRFVRLGNFENLLYENNINENLEFEFLFKAKNTDFFKESIRGRVAPVPRLLRNFFSPWSGAVKSDDDYCLSLKISLKSKDSHVWNVNLKPVDIDRLEFKIWSEKGSFEKMPARIMELKSTENKEYLLKWENLPNVYSPGKEPNSSGQMLATVWFANLFPVLIQSENDPSRDTPTPIEYFLKYCVSELFEGIFNSVTYIGPLREEPSRRYIYEDEVVEMGIKGENAAYIYLTEKKSVIKNHYFFNTENNEFFKKEEGTLNSAVDEWLELMNIKALRSVAKGEIIHLKLKAGSSNKTTVNIADVGFGVSQIFPIILEGLRMRSSGTLLLEQPEIHLHPNLQMQLADYFISLALSGKNVMVETHSDHMINRLVRRIIEDRTGNLKDLIGIYFIKNTPDGSVAEEIIVDETSGIINWPLGFFDQNASEQEKIIRAGINKRKMNK